jgi:alkylhydroperoxidase family enzyme
MARLSEAGNDGADLAGLTPAERIRRTTRAIRAHRREIAAPLEAFGLALREHRTLPSRLIELVRLRIAFHNQCRSCMAIRYRDGVDDGVDEDLVCSLERPADATDLTDQERVALDFADRFATDHLSIDADMYDRLRGHFDDGEVVELGLNCANFVGFGRLSATWHMVDDLPERFCDSSGSLVTPWGGSAIIVE